VNGIQPMKKIFLKNIYNASVLCERKTFHTQCEGDRKGCNHKEQSKTIKGKVRLLRNNKNTFYAGKLGEPSLAEGSGIFGDVAMAVGDLAIKKGIPYLA